MSHSRSSNSLTSILGLHIAVFWQCVFYILPQVIRSRTRGAIGRLVYVVTMFLIGTTYFVSNTKLALLMFVDHRLYPGGPSSWLTSHTENVVNVIDIVTFMLCTFLADGMLVSSCTSIILGESLTKCCSCGELTSCGTIGRWSCFCPFCFT